MKTFLDSRRATVAQALQLSDEILLVGAGDFVPLPGGADQTYPFRAHNEYFYLADRDRPAAVLAYVPGEGWTDFVPEVTEKEKVWVGNAPAEGTPLADFSAWLAARAGRPVVMLGTPVPLGPVGSDIAFDAARSEAARERLLHARRPKDAVELDRMRRAAAASAAGYAALRDVLRPGLTERQVQIELEAAFFRAGGERTAYDTIVGGGPNSGVLHFMPTSRVIGPEDLVLIDAGAEVERYASDVTRTYPASGRFRPEQRDLYAVVLEAETKAVAKCRKGKEFKEIHLECAVDLAAGLISMGVLKGQAQDRVADGAYTLFFPHGLGHLVGLGVRDASGRAPGREKDPRPELEYLRLDLPLEPGYTTTIEPGLYFIPALLESAERREKYAQVVDWSLVDRFLAQGLGGIRIEDNILVTEGEPENLTAAIPKELAEIER